MALLRVHLLNLRLCGRNLSRSRSPVAVRCLSDRVLPKAEAASGPDTASDHLLYTPEHLALKESLRKVRRRAAGAQQARSKLPLQRERRSEMNHILQRRS